MKFFRSVGEIFGYSPFKALRRHASLCGRAVGVLQREFEALRRGDWEEVEALREEIDELEHDADKIKEEIRTNLRRSLMLVVDRHDLLEFLRVQDDIINYCEHVGHMLTFREVKAPENVWKEFEILLSKIMEAVNEYEELVDHISKLVERSFSKKEVEATVEHVPRIERLEHECDLVQIGLHKLILNCDLDPLDAYLMSQWVVKLGEIANSVARAADRFRTMLLGR
ncbi:MAG: TIGR00153 family protein [Archaeoglobaceae archaeon]